ncbi:MAG: SRPBCC family protein [Rudaea sp.]
MLRIEKTITIDVPVEEVFAYVANPRNEPEWQINLMSIHDVTGEGVGQHYRWDFKMAGVLLHGESNVTEYVLNRRYQNQSRGGAVSTWTSTFEPQGAGTRWTLTVDYALPIPVVGRVAEAVLLKQNDKGLELSMQSVKDKLEHPQPIPA